MDVATRYNRKGYQFCGGLDPYHFFSVCLPTHLKDHDIRNYLLHRQSAYSFKEFAAKKSLQSIKFYEAGYVQSIRGKKICEDYVMLGRVSNSSNGNSYMKHTL